MKKRSKSQATMDKFVVRSPKVSPTASPSKDKGILRQATLESLKGVVVVEEMERARVVLERTDVSTELKIDTLQHLLCKTPAKEVLIRTKLGKTVHNLCRAEEAEVAAAAQQVYTAWKKHILSKVNRPYIEVKCDLKTQKLRNSARQMLFDALQKVTEEGGDQKNSRRQNEVEDCKSSRDSEKEKGEWNTKGNSTHKRPRDDSDMKSDIHKHKRKQEEKGEQNTKGNSSHKRPREDSDTEKYVHKAKQKEEEDGERKGEVARTHKNPREESDAQHNSVDMLAEHLEQKVYLNSQRRVDNGYRRTIRSMVFTLMHQSDIRKAVISATLSVEDFVQQHKKS